MGGGVFILDERSPVNAFPYYQPYQPAYAQPFKPPQTVQGRIVASEGEISPGEVTMGELPCYFPQSDGSCVIAKSWNADGTIKTVRYVPDGDDGDGYAAIMEKLDSIERAVKPKRRKADEDGQ